MRALGLLRLSARLCFGAVLVAGAGGLVAAATYARYDYPVGSRVVAQSDSAGAFQFVALGDIEDETVGFEDLVHAVDARSRPEFGVILGDLAKRSYLRRTSYVEYFDLLGRLRPDYPIFAVPGNHDAPPTGARDEYANAFGPRNWWFVHEECLFVGIDDSKGEPTSAARVVLRRAAREARRCERVFVFLHVPLWGPGVEPGEHPERTAARSQRAMAALRESLGAPIDVLVSAHAESWSVERDELGTLHVCCGAEPGLGWPAGSTPQIAASFTVTQDDVRVECVRVPYRRDLATTVRQAGYVHAYDRLRRLAAPIPVWLLTILAFAGWAALRPRPPLQP